MVSPQKSSPCKTDQGSLGTRSPLKRKINENPLNKNRCNCCKKHLQLWHLPKGLLISIDRVRCPRFFQALFLKFETHFKYQKCVIFMPLEIRSSFTHLTVHKNSHFDQGCPNFFMPLHIVISVCLFISKKYTLRPRSL